MHGLLHVQEAPTVLHGLGALGLHLGRRREWSSPRSQWPLDCQAASGGDARAAGKHKHLLPRASKHTSTSASTRLGPLPLEAALRRRVQRLPAWRLGTA